MLGGPLRIPGLISAAKRILFTFELEFQRNRTGTASDPATVPTALERTGDFSQSAYTIYDPSTGSPFPGNQIPATRSIRLRSLCSSTIPNPNLPVRCAQLPDVVDRANNSHNLNSRISNVRIGGKDRLNFGLGYQGSNTVTPNLFQFIDTGSGRGINAEPGLVAQLQHHAHQQRELHLQPDAPGVLALLCRPRERGGRSSASWAPRRTP